MTSTRRLDLAAAAKIRASEEYAAALQELREHCGHATLLECGYQSNMWGDLLPRRICEACGVEEEGWTFSVLTGRAYPVARDALYRARR